MPAARAAWVHFAAADLSNAAMSSGVLMVMLAISAASRSCSSGKFRMVTNSLLSRVMISRGVPAGAR